MLFAREVHSSTAKNLVWILAWILCPFLVIFYDSTPVSAVTFSDLSGNSTCSLECPSNVMSCWHFPAEEVEVVWGFNGYICKKGECFGNGPKEWDNYTQVDDQSVQLWPQVIQLGDSLVFKSIGVGGPPFFLQTFHTDFTSFSTCNFATATALTPGLVTTPVQVPEEYINSTGVKYFIGNGGNLYSCQFGLKLQLLVLDIPSDCVDPMGSSKVACSNKGVCYKNTSLPHSCHCCTAYSGTYCSEYDACYDNPCLNDGTCIDKQEGLGPGFNCACPPGFTGTRCQIDIDDCKPNPCDKEAICIDNINGYTCLCTPGWEGKNCSKAKINMCNELDPCKNGASCTPDYQNESYVCDCTSEWRGVNCTELIPVTSSSVITTTISTVTLVSSIDSTESSIQTSYSSLDKASSTIETQPSSYSVSPDLSEYSVSSVYDDVQTSQLPSVSATPVITTVLSTIDVSPSVQTGSSLLPESSLLPSMTSTGVPSPVQSTLVTSVAPTMGASPTESMISVMTTPIVSPSELSTLDTVGSSVITPTPSASSSIVMSSSVTPKPTPDPSTLNCSDSPCNNGTCLDCSVDNNCAKLVNYTWSYRCQCPVNTRQPLCEETGSDGVSFPSFNGYSYITLKAIAFHSTENKIVISFRTTQADGLLFYAVHSTHVDFIQLLIVGGKLKFLFNPGDALSTLTSTIDVNTGEIITAVVRYDSRTATGYLEVGGETIFKQSPGRLTGIQLLNEWNLGGLPANTSLGTGAEQTQSFIGCIKELEVNGHKVAFNNDVVLEWQSIGECVDSACSHVNCNNGTCVPDPSNPYAFTCKCNTGWTGALCSDLACIKDECVHGNCVRDTMYNQDVCLCEYGWHSAQCDVGVNITSPAFTSVDHKHCSYMEYSGSLDALDQFDVSFDFKVENSTEALSEGVMLYIARNHYLGTVTDFFAVGIKDGRVLLTYDLGSGTQTITSQNMIDQNKSWHTVIAGRSGRDGYLKLDDQEQQRGTSPGALVGLDVHMPLYVGGVPELSVLPTTLPFRNACFRGSIYRLGLRTTLNNFWQLSTSLGTTTNGIVLEEGRNVREESIKECDTDPSLCKNGANCIALGASFICQCTAGWRGFYCDVKAVPCLEYNPCHGEATCKVVADKAVCECPLGWGGPYCADRINITVASFHGNSYMEFKNTQYLVRSTSITIKFKPKHSSGVLFYTARDATSTTGDFLIILLLNRYVEYRFNLGDGTLVIKSASQLQLNQWHQVVASRTDRKGTLQVNGGQEVSKVAYGLMLGLNVENKLFIGGVADLMKVSSEAYPSQTRENFQGCIDDVQVNSNMYTVETAAVGLNILSCDVDCDGHQCKNGAKCHPKPSGTLNYTCYCSLGWNGELCENTLSLGSSAKFLGDSFFLYKDPKYILYSIQKTYVKMSFTTSQSNGLIYWTGKLGAEEDFLALGLENGKVKLSFNLGSGENVIISNPVVSDGASHSIEVNRTNSVAQLYIDGTLVNTVTSSGSHVGLDASDEIFIGGLDGDVQHLTNNIFRGGFVGCISNVIIHENSPVLSFDKGPDSSGENVKKCT